LQKGKHQAAGTTQSRAGQQKRVKKGGQEKKTANEVCRKASNLGQDIQYDDGGTGLWVNSRGAKKGRALPLWEKKEQRQAKTKYIGKKTGPNNGNTRAKQHAEK